MQSSLYSAKIQRTYELGAEVSFLFGCFNAGLSLVGTGAMVLVLWYVDQRRPLAVTLIACSTHI